MMRSTKNPIQKFFEYTCLFVSLAFAYLPILVLILFSFNSADLSLGWQGFSLRWYKDFFASAEMLSTLKTSFIVASSASFLSIFFSLLFIMGHKLRKFNFWFQVFLLNTVMPELVLAVAVLAFFVLFNIQMGYLSLIAGHTLLGFGITIPMIKNAFSELDPVITEASLDLGATYWQTFYNITLPLLRPTVIAATFLVFTLSLDDFFVAFFCAGPELQTISTLVFAKIRSMADPTLNVLSTFLFLFSLFLVFIVSVSNGLSRVFKDD